MKKKNINDVLNHPENNEYTPTEYELLSEFYEQNIKEVSLVDRLRPYIEDYEKCVHKLHSILAVKPRRVGMTREWAEKEVEKWINKQLFEDRYEP